MATRAIFAGLLLTTAGCAALRPTAEVTAVHVTETTAEGARVMVTVEVANRDDIALPLPHATYDLSVDGLGTFRFTDVTGVTLPPRARRS